MGALQALQHANRLHPSEWFLERRAPNSVWHPRVPAFTHIAPSVLKLRGLCLEGVLQLGVLGAPRALPGPALRTEGSSSRRACWASHHPRRRSSQTGLGAAPPRPQTTPKRGGVSPPPGQMTPVRPVHRHSALKPHAAPLSASTRHADAHIRRHLYESKHNAVVAMKTLRIVAGALYPSWTSRAPLNKLGASHRPVSACRGGWAFCRALHPRVAPAHQLGPGARFRETRTLVHAFMRARSSPQNASLKLWTSLQAPFEFVTLLSLACAEMAEPAAANTRKLQSVSRLTAHLLHAPTYIKGSQHV